MAKKGPCFKDLWDLARLGQVCATGERDALAYIDHWAEAAAQCRLLPQAASVESQEGGPKEQLGSFMWSTPFALPDTNPHRNAMHLCTVVCVLFFPRKRRSYKPETWHTILGSRLKLTIQFHKGFLILQWGKSFLVVKCSASWEVDPGS